MQWRARMISPRLSALFPILIGASVAGCATPSPIYRLFPNSQDVIWVGGRGSMQKEIEGVRVATSFEHQDGNALALRLEIQNGTPDRVDVGPRDVTFSACSSMRADSCAPTGRAVDPEAVLAALDDRQASEVASAKNSQAALGALVLLSAVGDIATIASGKADSTTGLATASTASLAASDAASHDSSLASIEAQRQLWSNEAFRRNTLLPGQGTSGHVFIPIYPDARIVWLHVKVGPRTFSFPFTQDVIEVSPRRTTPYGHRTADDS
jgi:hypothetical protein